MDFDATVAGDSATSYLTIEAADDLASADLGPEATAWAAAEPADKEKALMRATREIDGYLRSGWRRYLSSQRLLFPREIDYHGSPAAPFLPRNVQLACYEQATYVLVNADTLDRAQTRRAQQRKSVAEPNASYTRDDDDGGSLAYLSAAALRYLEGFRSAGATRRMHSSRLARGVA